MKCVICKTGTTKQGLVTVTVDVNGLKIKDTLSANIYPNSYLHLV